LAYCRRCEVRAECLQAALELGQRAIAPDNIDFGRSDNRSSALTTPSNDTSTG
jgi:hypothetical protein